MLKKNYEFRIVLKNGKYFSGEFLEAFIYKNSKKYKNSRGSQTRSLKIYIFNLLAELI